MSVLLTNTTRFLLEIHTRVETEYSFKECTQLWAGEDH